MANLTIRKVTRYQVQTATGKQEFESVQKARDYIENEIDAFFRPLLNRLELPAKKYIPFMEAVLKNREYLAHLLAYELDIEDDD
jgi:hypothetical protein